MNVALHECSNFFFVQIATTSMARLVKISLIPDTPLPWFDFSVTCMRNTNKQKQKQTTNMKINVKTKKKHKLNHWTKKCATDKHKHRKKYRPENSARKIDTCRCAFVLSCLLCHIKEWWWHKTLPNCSIFYTSVDHNP